MASLTLGTPFGRSHIDNFNIFDALDDSDDGTNSPASRPSSTVSEEQQHPVLGEVRANKAQAVHRASPDDIALQLETFHIVTPTKANKTRGLKPRPTIDFSTFDLPAEEQENPETIDETVGTNVSDAVDVAPSAPEG